MKKASCVRLVMFMRPKMSEKPAESRKSRPPRVTLLTASTSHKFMTVRLQRRRPEGAAEAPSRFERRVVARVPRLRQEPLLVIGREQSPLRVRLDRGVGELA